MTKYFKYISTKHAITGETLPDGGKRLRYYQPEGTDWAISDDPNNTDYARMMEAVEAGEAEIVEVDDTLVPTWEDNRIAAYGSWREQLDHMYHGTWEDHVASVKATYPKPE